MLHLTKREIYKAFADWYGLGGDSCDAMMQSGRLNHFNTGGWVMSDAARESADKAQLIWEVAQCAPELWSRDNKIDVGLIVGHDCDFSMALFPALSTDIQKQFLRDSTAMFLERKYLPLAPIAWYLNACSPLMMSLGVGQLGSVAHDSSAVVYDRVCSKLEAAVTFGLRNINAVEAHKDTAACYETMKRMIRAFKVSYYSLAEASLEYQASVNRNGFTVTWLYWNFMRNRWTAQDARDSLRRVDFSKVQVPPLPEGINANAKILDNADGFFEKVPMRKRPIIGANGIVQGFEPFFGATAQSKHDPRAPAGYDAADTMILSGTTAEYTFLTGRTEGDPLDNPVAAWLAETLRPRTINWVSDDPITDILEAAAEATAWKDAVGVTLAKQAAVLMHNLHQLNKGAIRHDMPVWGDFQTRIAKLADSGDVDGLFRYIYDVCGERVKLKVLTAAPALCHMTHRIGDGRYAILWESTGKHVISGLGDNKYDILSEDNIRHLRACYNAHIHKADRKPCSHSTSQKN